MRKARKNCIAIIKVGGYEGCVNLAVVGRSNSFLIFPILKISKDADLHMFLICC